MLQNLHEIQNMTKFIYLFNKLHLVNMEEFFFILILSKLLGNLWTNWLWSDKLFKKVWLFILCSKHFLVATKVWFNPLLPKMTYQHLTFTCWKTSSWRTMLRNKINKRTKLELKSMRCMFTRYDKILKLYHCFHPKTKMIIIVKYVVFYEKQKGLTKI
jgi:hypothetical protein